MHALKLVFMCAETRGESATVAMDCVCKCVAGWL